jgi:hypothetical protein
MPPDLLVSLAWKRRSRLRRTRRWDAWCRDVAVPRHPHVLVLASFIDWAPSLFFFFSPHRTRLGRAHSFERRRILSSFNCLLFGTRAACAGLGWGGGTTRFVAMGVMERVWREDCRSRYFLVPLLILVGRFLQFFFFGRHEKLYFKGRTSCAGESRRRCLRTDGLDYSHRIQTCFALCSGLSTHHRGGPFVYI